MKDYWEQRALLDKALKKAKDKPLTILEGDTPFWLKGIKDYRQSTNYKKAMQWKGKEE